MYHFEIRSLNKMCKSNIRVIFINKYFSILIVHINRANKA